MNGSPFSDIMKKHGANTRKRREISEVIILEKILGKCTELFTTIGLRIVLALVVFTVGCILIKAFKKMMIKAEKFSRLEKTVQSFLKNLLGILLYVILIITVISILGIPMSSVIAVLASCGLAVGLALQGALTNFAGGIMILIFKPFRVGDFIEVSDSKGTVTDIGIFYTSVVTGDRKRITIPNGDLMNSSVINYSIEEFRRVDIELKITNDCNPDVAKAVLLKAAEETEGFESGFAPFARLTAVDDDTYIFTVRAWCKNENYYNTYLNLLENCSRALSENGIDDPEERIAVRIVNDD